MQNVLAHALLSHELPAGLEHQICKISVKTPYQFSHWSNLKWAVLFMQTGTKELIITQAAESSLLVENWVSLYKYILYVYMIKHIYLLYMKIACIHAHGSCKCIFVFSITINKYSSSEVQINGYKGNITTKVRPLFFQHGTEDLYKKTQKLPTTAAKNHSRGTPVGSLSPVWGTGAREWHSIPWVKLHHLFWGMTFEETKAGFAISVIAGFRHHTMKVSLTELTCLLLQQHCGKLHMPITVMWSCSFHHIRHNFPSASEEPSLSIINFNVFVSRKLLTLASIVDLDSFC